MEVRSENGPIKKPPFPLPDRFPSKFEQKLYLTYNWFDNRLWPVRPAYFAATAAAIGAYHYRNPHNALLQLLPVLENKYAEVGKVVAVSLASTYAPVFLLRKFLKYFYFSYKAWLFEDPKKPSLLTKFWGVWRKLLSLSPPLLKSADRLLPSPSCPDLEDTIKRYLASVRHLHSEEDYQQIVEQAESFLKNEGPRLQWYARCYSMFVDNYVTPFWEKYAYLYGRESLLVNSSVAHTDLMKVRPATLAYRAAHVTFIEGRSQLAIHRQAYKPLGDGLLCARHYDKMYAVTRVPGEKIDRLERYGVSKHIALLYRGRFYKVPICDNKNRMYTIQELAKIFNEVIKRGEKAIEGSASLIPALTADRRDLWCANREKFFIKNAVNKKALEMIEEAVFFLVFDENEYGYEASNPDVYSNFQRNLLTGNGANRWADKSLNYIISKNSRCGGTTEHSIADGSEFDNIMENFVYIEENCIEAYPPVEEQQRLQVLTSKDEHLILAEEMPIETNEEMLKEVDRAHEYYGKTRDDVDMAATVFLDFGKGRIKKCGVSPDAFIQMAIQLANYRDQGKFVLTYEPASARFFKNSRTETLRSVTDESCAFVKAMEDTNCTNARRIELLKTAALKHGKHNRECMVGRGVDRHLFVLFVLSQGTGISSPFLDHYISQPWLLSTSQPPNVTNQVDEDAKPEITWMGASFGAVAKAGYGICYRFGGNHSILCHITSYKSAPNTDSARFRTHLTRAFHEMADLFENKN